MAFNMFDSGYYSALLYIVILLTIYLTARTIYLLLLHPLHPFPGPLTWRLSRLPYIWAAIHGHLPMTILALHAKYGPFVRVAPNELAISHQSAWHDVMTGGGGGGKQELSKWTEYYRVQDPQPMSILTAPDETHAALRRGLAAGFADRSIREMEGVLRGYIGLFTRRLGELCCEGEAGEEGQGTTVIRGLVGGQAVMPEVDLHAWLNFLSFDLVGDLAFGESYGCLKNGEYHPWVAPIFEVTHMNALMSSLGHYPWLKRTLLRVFRRVIETKMREHQAHTKIKLKARMGMQRADLIEGLLKTAKTDEKSIDDLNMDASVLVVAGAETTATTLSAVIYLLLNNPSNMTKLLTEIRGTFTSEDEITIASVSRLEYMLACLNETMRLFPPVPVGLPRVVSREGRSISGQFIPGNNLVSIWHWAVYRDPTLFTKPLSFCPERFMGDPEFATDKLDAIQPFHLGKRSCIGRPLAYVEMRLILAHFLFNFDVELTDESRDWMERGKAYSVWWKPPLKLRISKRKCVG